MQKLMIKVTLVKDFQIKFNNEGMREKFPDKTVPIYIDAAFIEGLEEKYNCTVLAFNSAKEMYVAESPEEILDKIKEVELASTVSIS